jgi:hypothetical protein
MPDLTYPGRDVVRVSCSVERPSDRWDDPFRIQCDCGEQLTSTIILSKLRSLLVCNNAAAAADCQGDGMLWIHVVLTVCCLFSFLQCDRFRR